MAIPATYVYRQGGYFERATGKGPFAWNGTAMVALTSAGVAKAGTPASYIFLAGAYWGPDGSGPFVIT